MPHKANPILPETLVTLARFNAVLAEYVKAREVTERRLYLETMQAVLPRVKNKVVVDEDAASVLPLLNLNSTKGGRP